MPQGAVEERPPSARALALEALTRVDEGAFANLVLPEILRHAEGRTPLEGREKAFATELVYGTVRMRRACDWLIGQHVSREPDDETLRLLHLGAYQLAFLDSPAYAAVGSTVELAPRRSQGFVNAVLRSLARSLEEAKASGSTTTWPNLATELSYPDWIVSTLERDLGPVDAHEALRRMNEPAAVHRREDGYVQDPASRQVAQAILASVGSVDGMRVLDLCAAPGGKATALASAGASVVAVDLHPHRCRLTEENAEALGLADRIDVRCLDATRLPGDLRAFDLVLVDAPCSGLGSLRRRPDARWRIQGTDVAGLVQLQRKLVRSAAEAARPAGDVFYSVCTLTAAETSGVDAWVDRELGDLRPRRLDGLAGWDEIGNGRRVLPGDTDGMALFRYGRQG